jgi:catechol 2,3-dioxygenase-like lactoylglutathione lyase family enzyme
MKYRPQEDKKMKILRVESIIYGADDLETGERFFRDWGVKPVEGAKATFTLPSGQTIVVKPASDPSLPKAPEQGPTVREVIWGVDNAQSLDELKKELGRDREVKVDADGTLHSVDDVGFGIGFRVAKPAAAGAASQSARMNKPFDPPRTATPMRMGHVVYSIPREAQAKAAAFYTQRLQFRMTDHTGDLGDFMRCNGSNDHHNLFFLLPPNRAAFNHVAFEVRDFDEIIFGGQSMRNKGWKSDSPPGRHILGSNLFWYFSNPSGGNVEYFADMDQMDDDFQTRNWEKTPGFAMWTLDKADIPSMERRPPAPKA